MRKILKTASMITLPFALLILAYLGADRTQWLTEPQLDLLGMAPYPIFLIGGVLAWKFNRSREFFLLLVFALTLALLQYSPQAGAVMGKVLLEDLLLLISLILPANILIFSFFKERGIFSMWGMTRVGVIAAQAAAAVWLMKPEQQSLLHQWRKDLLPFSLEKYTSLSQAALFLVLLAAIRLIYRQISRPSSQDVSFLAVLLGLGFALHQAYDPLLIAVFWAVSGIILISSIIQDSYSMAFSDELTGLPSRRALKQDMLKLGMNYTIAMLDIDFFKKFNDKYGHDTGDDVLKLVASILREVTGGGKAFRYGGEEFTILFPGRSVSEVLPHLEQLREKVAGRGFTLRGKGRRKGKGRSRSKSGSTRAGRTIHITISIGIAQKNEKNKTPDEVMKAADTALYRAKKKGRNCVSK